MGFAGTSASSIRRGNTKAFPLGYLLAAATHQRDTKRMCGAATMAGDE